MTPSTEEKDRIEFIRRYSTFNAFTNQSLTKQELATMLGVSRPTAHRIVTHFEARQVIIKRGGRYELTRYGEIVGAAVTRYAQEVTAATALAETLNSLPQEMALDHTLFSTATVTVATSDNPFSPVTRLLELLEGSTTLNAFNTRFLEPLYVDRLRQQIDSIEFHLIYTPSVLALVERECPEFIETVTTSSRHSISVHDELPLMLSILDSRVGIGVSPADGGTPIRWVDTGEPDAHTWASDMFESYRTDATRRY